MENSTRKTEALLTSWSVWLADKKPRPLRPTTRYQYVRRIRKAIQIANNGGYSLLTGDIRTVRFVLGTASPHPSSQNGYLNALRLFYDFLKERGARRDNPAREIGRTPSARTTPRPLSIEDCCAYLDAAAALGPRERLCAVLGLYSGLRKTEIRSVRWSWFFLVDERLWMDVSGKGGHNGRVPVHPAVRTALDAVRATHNDAMWVLPSPVRPGEAISGAWVHATHHRIRREAELPACTLHQLRHSFATWLRRTGVDIAVVQKGLRHQSLVSTQIYTAILDDELAAAIDRLDFRNVPDVAAGGKAFERREEGSE